MAKKAQIKVGPKPPKPAAKPKLAPKPEAKPKAKKAAPQIKPAPTKPTEHGGIKPIPKTKVVAKSAKTGKMVSKKFAEANPDTTYETTVEAKGGAPAAPWCPEAGVKFLLNGKLASMDVGGNVTLHELKGGCQSDTILGQVDLTGAQPIDREEAFRMLAG